MEDFLKFLLIAGVILVGIFKEVNKNSKAKKAKAKHPVPPMPSPVEVNPDTAPMPEAWGRPKSLEELFQPILREQPVAKQPSKQQTSKQKKKKEQRKKTEKNPSKSVSLQSILQSINVFLISHKRLSFKLSISIVTFAFSYFIPSLAI